MRVLLITLISCFFLQSKYTLAQDWETTKNYISDKISTFKFSKPFGSEDVMTDVSYSAIVLSDKIVIIQTATLREAISVGSFMKKYVRIVNNYTIKIDDIRECHYRLDDENGLDYIKIYIKYADNSIENITRTYLRNNRNWNSPPYGWTDKEESLESSLEIYDFNGGDKMKRLKKAIDHLVKLYGEKVDDDPFAD